MSARLEDLQRSFGRHLRAEGRSERTVTIYGQAIRFYGEWLVAQGRPATLEELNRAAVREWLAQLTERQELSTVRTRHKGLQRFCGWLVAEGEIAANPMAGLEAPTAHAKPVPVLTDADLAALLKACSGKTFPDRRDEALIRVLLDCGVRISEACGLTVEGVYLDDGMALVKGKGSKVRPVYMGTRTVRSLDRYLRARAQERWAHMDTRRTGGCSTMSWARVGPAFTSRGATERSSSGVEPLAQPHAPAGRRRGVHQLHHPAVGDALEPSWADRVQDAAHCKAQFVDESLREQ